MKKYTEEQIKFIVEYPDFPSWLIVEAFYEKFGFKVGKSAVLNKRAAARGSSNIHYRHGTDSRKRRILKYDIDRVEHAESTKNLDQ